MTKTEAIAMLKRIQEPEAWEPQINQAAFEALDMAIEALSSSEFPNNSDDTISRQVAIEAIGKTSDELYENIKKGATFPQRQWFDGMAQAQSILENLPSAQPETAKRIVGKSRDGMTLWYQCDMCNEPVDEHDNFCRGCGRRLIDGRFNQQTGGD